MKKLLRFQLKELRYSYLIYALVMLLLTAGIPVCICFAYNDVNMNIQGSEMSGVLLCLVIGLGIYREHFWMAVQNSIPRKSYFQSILCVAAVTSCVCTLVDLVISFLGLLLGRIFSGSSYINVVSFWQMCYSGFFERSGSAAGVIVSFLLSVFAGIFMFAAGTMIAGGYCRAAKRYRTLYLVMLPLFAFGVLPAAGVYFHRETAKLADLFMEIMGVASGNPFLGILSMAVMDLVILFFCYRILRRTEIN